MRDTPKFWFWWAVAVVILSLLVYGIPLWAYEDVTLP